jgi:hypothetical protein
MCQYERLPIKHEALQKRLIGAQKTGKRQTVIAWRRSAIDFCKARLVKRLGKVQNYVF